MTGNEICQKLQELSRGDAGLETLLQRAVELLHESNPRFHWTGIYELYPDNVLRLGPFLGAPTDHVFIAVGRGVCGTAVAENRNINVPDVTQAPNYLACSSETRSELVILIRNGDKIYAQIDIDSHELDAFDCDAVTQVEQVAEFLAGAYAASKDDGAGETQLVQP
jgi:L-methionine (R)-S-oxide reductase